MSYMIAGRTILILIFFLISYQSDADDSKRYKEETDTLKYININYVNFLSDSFPYEDTSVYCSLNKIYYVAQYQGGTPYLYMFNNDYIIYLYPPFPLGTFEKTSPLINCGTIEIYNKETDKIIIVSVQNEIKELKGLICYKNCYKFKFNEFIYLINCNQKPVINPNLFNDILKVINNRKVRKKFKDFYHITHKQH